MGVEGLQLHGSKDRVVAYDGCGEHVITSSKGGMLKCGICGEYVITWF